MYAIINTSQKFRQWEQVIKFGDYFLLAKIFGTLSLYLSLNNKHVHVRVQVCARSHITTEL